MRPSGGTATRARGLVETSGPTTLQVAAIADGEGVKRVGSTLVGFVIGGGGGGTMDHAALTSNLAWTSSLHTGTASRLAGFSGAGAAAYYAIGTDVQAYDAGLASLTAADAAAGFAYPNAANTWTALTGWAQGELLYASSASAFARLAVGTAGLPLLTGGAGANPAWGVLGVAAGGTSFSSYTAGDYIAATASTTLAKVPAPTYPGSAAPAWDPAGAPSWRAFRPLSGMGGACWEVVFTETAAQSVGFASLSISGTPSVYSDAIGKGILYTAAAGAGSAVGWRITADVSACQSGGCQFFSCRIGGESADTRTWIGVVTGGSGFPNSTAYTTEHVAIYADPATNSGKWVVSHADGVTQDAATDTGIAYAANTEVCVMFVWASGGAECRVYMGTTPRNMTLVKTVTTNMPDTTDSLRPDGRLIRTAVGGAKTMVWRGASGVTPV